MIQCILRFEPPRTKVVTTTASAKTAPPTQGNLRPLQFGLLRQRIGIAAVLEHLFWRPQSQTRPLPLHEPPHTFGLR